MDQPTDSPLPAKNLAWATLVTEARHPASLELDTLPPEEAVRLVLEEDRRGLEMALLHRGAIARVAGWFRETLEQGGRVHLVGAGTSGRLAVLEASECPPTFGTDPSQIVAHLAGGPEAVFQAREGAEDRADEGRAAMAGLESRDLVIGISASSVTSYVRGALEAAREQGLHTVLLTCAAPSIELDAVAELVIALETGPEILTGSTRLKAGSATKAVLNAITTAGMVALGKVYQNLMVDLRPGSAKLRDRAVRIVAMATGLESANARAQLDAANGEVKTAIVMSRLGLAPAAARELLTTSQGHVRRALATGSTEASP